MVKSCSFWLIQAAIALAVVSPAIASSEAVQRFGNAWLLAAFTSLPLATIVLPSSVVARLSTYLGLLLSFDVIFSVGVQLGLGYEDRLVTSILPLFFLIPVTSASLIVVIVTTSSWVWLRREGIGCSLQLGRFSIAQLGCLITLFCAVVAFHSMLWNRASALDRQVLLVLLSESLLSAVYCSSGAAAISTGVALGVRNNRISVFTILAMLLGLVPLVVGSAQLVGSNASGQRDVAFTWAMAVAISIVQAIYFGFLWRSSSPAFGNKSV